MAKANPNFYYERYLPAYEVPEYKLLSLSDKGALAELEGLSAKGKPYGHITTATGNAIPREAVAALLGLGIKEWDECHIRLREAGFLRCAKSGTLTLPHLIARENVKKKRKNNGRKGGNPSICSSLEKTGLVNQKVKQLVKHKEIIENRNKEKNTKKEKKPPDKSDPLWFDGSVIKLNKAQYFQWCKAWHVHEDTLWKRLENYDDWYAKQPEEDQKNWFMRVASRLSREFEQQHAQQLESA